MVCKNPLCSNFGIAASSERQPRGKTLKSKDIYKVVNSSRKTPVLQCLACNEYPPIKSNQDINEEIERMSAYLKGTTVSCPHSCCDNHHVSIKSGKAYYSSFGKTSGGSQRYKCKSCLKIFTVRKSTAGQRSTHKNKIVFSLLMNKVPFKRICEVAPLMHVDSSDGMKTYNIKTTVQYKDDDGQPQMNEVPFVQGSSYRGVLRDVMATIIARKVEASSCV